jgi:hypothetical protein
MVVCDQVFRRHLSLDLQHPKAADTEPTDQAVPSIMTIPRPPAPFLQGVSP